jgi:hypothetical protein
MQPEIVSRENELAALRRCFDAAREGPSHLTHIYAKLGVRSRTEPAHLLHLREPAQRGKVQTF